MDDMNARDEIMAVVSTAKRQDDVTAVLSRVLAVVAKIDEGVITELGGR